MAPERGAAAGPGRQLPLDLGVRHALGRDDFLVSAANRDAVAWIDRWPDWPPPGIVLIGPPASGKTHLAHVWQARAQAQFVIGPPEDRNSAAALIVEDAETVPERNLLSLFNTARARGTWLLLTARTAPAQWPGRLPDVRSRLGTMPVIAIEAPDDALFSAVLIKHFADRQLVAAPEVIAFLMTRLERSFDAARRAVAAVDAAALEQQRPPTVPLVRQVLESLGPQ